MPVPHECPCRICQQQPGHPEQARHKQLRALLGFLDERQKRWVAALEANRLGRGGIRLVSQCTGLDEKTLRRGRRELTSGLEAQPQRRVRRAGAGRRSSEA